ncbi:MAG: Nramp family divalent metal transporter [Acidobacteria bacterium]|nr:Nramp family divalent metal transporter [Acidobacteriota bacterium]
MKRLASIMLWSVLAAAFIGPGTVTTAASAGARFGYALLWALVFSTVACVVLQEAAARLTIAGGLDLGQALRERYPTGVGRAAVLALVLGAVIIGCAAYEAGNILGGVAGAQLVTDVPQHIWTLALGAVAAVLLWFNSPTRVAQLLALLVAIMGVAFLWSAYLLRPEIEALLRGALRPSLPADSAVLALGLVGTTVVPYNLFLGSGLASGGKLGETRFGIIVAVGLGGLISMGVLVVGAALAGTFTFEALTEILVERLGSWAGPLVPIGLLAAGLSSAVTAPLAAAITARGLFEKEGQRSWDMRGWRYRSVWAGVLAVGVGFGVSGARPVPVILVAQALNGILLPVVAIFLFLAVNDRRQMGARALNGRLANLLTAGVVAVSVVLGLNGLGKAAARVLDVPPLADERLLAISAGLLVILAIPLGRALIRARKP